MNQDSSSPIWCNRCFVPQYLLESIQNWYNGTIRLHGGERVNRYRLAICEGDDGIRAQLHFLCQEILTENGIDHCIPDFSSSQQLEKRLAAESAPFDLLFLDIQMEGMTGMELAQSLRQRGGGRKDILSIERHLQL